MGILTSLKHSKIHRWRTILLYINTVSSIKLHMEITKSARLKTKMTESSHRLNEIFFLLCFTQLLYINLSVSFMLYNDMFIESV